MFCILFFFQLKQKQETFILLLCVKGRATCIDLEYFLPPPFVYIWFHHIWWIHEALVSNEVEKKQRTNLNLVDCHYFPVTLHFFCNTKYQNQDTKWIKKIVPIKVNVLMCANKIKTLGNFLCVINDIVS